MQSWRFFQDTIDKKLSIYAFAYLSDFLMFMSTSLSGLAAWRGAQGARQPQKLGTMAWGFVSWRCEMDTNLV